MMNLNTGSYSFFSIHQSSFRIHRFLEHVMIGIVVVTHGRLADELIAASRLIVGAIDAIEGISIAPDEDMDAAQARILDAIRRVDSGQGVLILTDLFGGTPSNLSLSFLSDRKVEVLSGANLPMLLSLATGREEKPLEEVAEMAMNAGKKNITLASRILNMKISAAKK
jgi:PTS system mannose-specific IIA component